MLTLALLISHRRIRLMDEPSTAAMVQEPNAAAGFELAPGGPPGDERRYRSSVIVPSGYALTLTAVLCSNQVVLKPSPGSASATLMAPQGQPIQGILSWKLLGGTTLADGAPLQFSLGLAGAEAGDKTFHIVPSEPIAIDWAAEPPRLWPPENGHTKFLLVNGLSRASPGGTEPSIEWGVGVEARLDPIPENMLRDLKSPVVTLATNWLGRVEDVSSPSENLDHFSDTRTQTQDEAAEH